MSTNAIYCITCTYWKKLNIGEKGRRLSDGFREHLRDVQRNNRDASKPVASHFNLHSHYKQHMAVCGLCLYLGSSEATKISHQPHNGIPQLVDVASSVLREYLIQDYRRSGPSTNNRWVNEFRRGRKLMYS